MRVLNYNINFFGGQYEHIEKFKEIYGSTAAYSEWDIIDKSDIVDGILSFVCESNPQFDALIFQEFDLNSQIVTSENGFCDRMDKLGYRLLHEETTYIRPSLTVFFIRKDFKISNDHVETGHKKNGRAYAVEMGDIILYGTHVPPKGDNKEFWNEMCCFLDKGMKINKSLLLVGDFNTINGNNLDYMNSMKLQYDNLIDVGEIEKMNPLSVAGDYVLASKNISKSIKISKVEMKLSDHPAIIVDINL